MSVEVKLAGEAAVVVVFGHAISDQTAARIRAFCRVLQQKKPKGVVEWVPTFCSVMVCCDPVVVSAAKLAGKLEKLADGVDAADETAKRVVEIPVCYGGRFGEDIDDVAEHAGITPAEVVAAHCAPDYLIYMLGFLPGFAYLGGLDARLATPRLSNPRTSIPAGSVGIGGEQTGIYPLASPGGWRLIGRTPVKPYNPAREQPILYSAGDYIRFVPIGEQEYARIEQLVSEGRYTCTVKEG